MVVYLFSLAVLAGGVPRGVLVGGWLVPLCIGGGVPRWVVCSVCARWFTYGFSLSASFRLSHASLIYLV